MRVLFVEDDILLGQALAAGLRQLGHAADWFTNGRDADGALLTIPYDAMVLDLGLPGGDGLVWLRRWRDRGIQLPVLVLTARDGIDQRIAGLDSGADDYLLKPITIDELAARLRALLRRASGRAQPTWRYGELEYDPASKLVRSKDAPRNNRRRRSSGCRGASRQRHAGDDLHADDRPRSLRSAGARHLLLP